MFSKTLMQAGHTRSFEVQAREADGWEVSVKEDTRIVRHIQYSDWHRVERALSAIRREVAALEDQGWRGDHALSG
jgi:methionine synthase II (cobalamin-independent)